jgi:hypothetical protein
VKECFALTLANISVVCEGWHSGWANNADQLDQSSLLAPDVSGAIAQVGVNPMREGCALQHALCSVMAGRRGSCSWDVDHAG